MQVRYLCETDVELAVDGAGGQVLGEVGGGGEDGEEEQQHLDARHRHCNPKSIEIHDQYFRLLLSSDYGVAMQCNVNV